MTSAAYLADDVAADMQEVDRGNPGEAQRHQTSGTRPARLFLADGCNPDRIMIEEITDYRHRNPRSTMPAETATSCGARFINPLVNGHADQDQVHFALPSSSAAGTHHDLPNMLVKQLLVAAFFTLSVTATPVANTDQAELDVRAVNDVRAEPLVAREDMEAARLLSPTQAPPHVLRLPPLVKESHDFPHYEGQLEMQEQLKVFHINTFLTRNYLQICNIRSPAAGQASRVSMGGVRPVTNEYLLRLALPSKGIYWRLDSQLQLQGREGSYHSFGEDHSSMWALFLFGLLLLHVVTIVCDEVKDQQVYFPSKQKPDEVKSNNEFAAPGFQDPSRGMFSVYEHIMRPSKVQNHTVYLSLFSDPTVAASWLGGDGGYVYQVHASPNMFPVRSTLGRNCNFMHHWTIVAMGKIYLEQIVSFSSVAANQTISPENAGAPWYKPQLIFEANDYYYGRDYDKAEMSPGQPQLAGYPEDHPSYNESTAVYDESQPSSLRTAGEEFLNLCASKPLPPCQGQLRHCMPDESPIPRELRISDADTLKATEYVKGAETMDQLYKVLKSGARAFSLAEHQRLTNMLDIDRSVSKLKPLREMRKLLQVYIEKQRRKIGFGRIAEPKGKTPKPLFRPGKVMVPGIVDILAAAYKTYLAFREDTDMLTRLAALTSWIVFVRCIMEYEADKANGERKPVQLVACTVGDVLLFTPLAPLGMVIHIVRDMTSNIPHIRKMIEIRDKFVSLREIKNGADREWGSYCNNISDYLKTDDYTNIHHDQFFAEIITIEYAAAEELSVLKAGYSLLLASSNNDEERESIQLSYAHGAARLYISMCDVIDARRQNLTDETHMRLMEFMEQKRIEFSTRFYQEWNKSAIEFIYSRDSLASIKSLTGVNEHRDIYRRTLEESLWTASANHPVKLPSWEKTKLSIPEKKVEFCKKYRKLQTANDRQQPVEEQDCHLNDFWDAEKLDRLRSGDMRCKLGDRSYGLNQLFLTSCPIQALQRSLNCTEKPTSVLEVEDFQLLQNAGIDKSLVQGGKAGEDGWTPPEVWTESPQEAAVDCKAKNMSWDFFTEDVVKLEQGRLGCRRINGRPWETMRRINGEQIEICRSLHSCQIAPSIEQLPFNDRPEDYGFPSTPPPPPWQSRLLDCYELDINWSKLTKGPNWLNDSHRRVAEGLDRCGSKDKGLNYWLQWHPKWSQVQLNQGRKYSSLVEYIDGEPHRRLDFNGSLPDAAFAEDSWKMGMPPNDSWKMGMPPNVEPPEDTHISGKPWDGTPPETSIICDDPHWEMHDADEAGVLRKNLIANSHVSCGRHGWDQTWHWADQGTKLVWCLKSGKRCIYWPDSNLQYMHPDTINHARGFKIPDTRPPPSLLPPKAKPGLDELTDSNLLELTSPEAVDGCARASDLSYNFRMGDNSGDGTWKTLLMRFGNSEWVTLAEAPSAGFRSGVTPVNLRDTFREKGHLDRNGNVYLGKITDLEIWQEGRSTIFEGGWAIGGSSGSELMGRGYVSLVQN
ncbi:hypothetical protein L249_5670 [Ophiocordyceps polyrhachis-furcata BCC 54312]|uniref:Uncharacterized protein n=1 Tax=Ophiocordyceps polyrhachis-furcata BCC 54312 TaxID=1330021 RepID=A0A367L0E9_9HYPO|nr:hypothetical protein L249_5670 [Ophiocordyceps polyrhachis-furcata BCC 54312]